MDKPVLASLVQRFPIARSQEVQLTEEEVRIRNVSPFSDIRRTIPLEAVDRNETEVKNFPAWSRIAAVVCVLLALIGALWGVRIGPALWPVSAEPVLWGALVSLGLALVAAIVYGAASTEVLVFYHSFTGEYIFALRRDLPDRSTVDRFSAQLKERAKVRYEQLQSDAERPSIAKEILALEGLCDKKVISREEFSLKKDELLDDMMRD